MHLMPSADNPSRSSLPSGVLYVAARLPKLSETFVYREAMGLRGRGVDVTTASLHAPESGTGDPALATLAAETLRIYAPATLAVLPFALAGKAGLMARAVREAAGADHAGAKARAKHVVQAAMGIATAWRLRRRGIGHVHAHMANAPTMVALYIARALGAGFSFTGHAADIFVHREALAFKLRQADFVSCISAWHRDFYRDIAPDMTGRLPVVRCSVTVPATVQPEGGDIVSVARLVPKKGLDLLIRAFAAAPDTGHRLRILGGGEEAGALQALVEELGLSSRVELAGARPHAECLAAIRGAAMFVLPCRTSGTGDKDGIPVVLMEAMAAGRAVIAGDLPAIRELVADGETGRLVPPDDVPALTAAITALTGDAARRAALGGAARAHVAAEFSDDINWDRLERAMAGQDELPTTAGATPAMTR